MTMLGLFADHLTERGYDLMLSRVIPDSTDWLEQSVDSGMLDGVLLIGQSDQRATIERVARRYLPLVVWGTTEPGQAHCAVGVDNVEGGRLAGAHLLARGCRRIVFLGETRVPELCARAEGVRAALAAAGIAADLPILPAPLASDTMERAVAAQLAAHGGKLDGIVAASDMLAMTALRVLADRGIAVPERVRVTGYDDLPLAVQTVPRLTTVRQDMARGAKAMVEALFARMNGVAAPGLVMPPELVVRDSA